MSENATGSNTAGTGYDPAQDPDSDPEMTHSQHPDEDEEMERDPAEGPDDAEEAQT
ncbi:hypothetical protein ACI3EY_00725 [Ornithinimicrobium sp. LYQ92]|uniref:hypothetical protein n=1 Tax=Serinicoccus sp. LYQ92 TaxID=3378798 RepID=UPI0038530ADF